MTSEDAPFAALNNFLQLLPDANAILATQADSKQATFELVGPDMLYFGASVPVKDLVADLQKQWKKSARERDFEVAASQILANSIAAARCSASGWSSRSSSESVHLHIQPAEYLGLPDFVLSLQPYTDGQVAMTTLFDIAKLSITLGQQQVQAVQDSARTRIPGKEINTLTKEINTLKRKNSNLHEDLHAQEALSVPSTSQDGQRSAPSSPAKPPPGKMKKGPLDFGRTGGRKLKRKQEFESGSDDDEQDPSPAPAPTAAKKLKDEDSSKNPEPGDTAPTKTSDTDDAEGTAKPPAQSSSKPSARPPRTTINKPKKKKDMDFESDTE